MGKYFFTLVLSVTFLSQTFAQNSWDLQRCIDYAMENNITVQQSKFNIDRAEINHSESKLSLLPSLNAQATHGYNFGQRIDPFTNEFATDRVRTNNLFMSTSLDIFNGFSKMNQMKMDKESVIASQYDLNKIKNDISLQLCLAYLQILLNKETVGIAEEQVSITQEQVDRMQKLVDAGQEPQGALYDTEAQLAQEELALTNAQNGVLISTLNLTQLLQLPSNETAGFDIEEPVLTDEGLAILDNSAIEIYNVAQNAMPEIMAAEHRMLSAEYALSSAKGRMYPNLSLSGSVGSGYSGANSVPTGEGIVISPQIGTVAGSDIPVVSLPQTAYSDFATKDFSDQLEDNFNQNLQFTLSIPIFNGYSANSAVKRAKINQMDADLSYKQISDQLRFEIEQAYTDAKAAMNSYYSAEKAVKSFEESFKYAEVRYEQNVINAVDYNNIKTNYSRAQSNLVNAKYDFVFRTKILDFYLGNPITL